MEQPTVQAVSSSQGVPSCSFLPSPTLKWEVIGPEQLGRKEQEGTPCKLETVWTLPSGQAVEDVMFQIKKNTLWRRF